MPRRRNRRGPGRRPNPTSNMISGLSALDPNMSPAEISGAADQGVLGNLVERQIAAAGKIERQFANPDDRSGFVYRPYDSGVSAGSGGEHQYEDQNLPGGQTDANPSASEAEKKRLEYVDGRSDPYQEDYSKWLPKDDPIDITGKPYNPAVYTQEGLIRGTDLRNPELGPSYEKIADAEWRNDVLKPAEHFVNASNLRPAQEGKDLVHTGFDGPKEAELYFRDPGQSNVSKEMMNTTAQVLGSMGIDRNRINSGMRSPSYNKMIGGARASMHMPGEDGVGRAIDVDASGWSDQQKAQFTHTMFSLGHDIITYDRMSHIHVNKARFDKPRVMHNSRDISLKRNKAHYDDAPEFMKALQDIGPDPDLVVDALAGAPEMLEARGPMWNGSSQDQASIDATYAPLVKQYQTLSDNASNMGNPDAQFEQPANLPQPVGSGQDISMSPTMPGLTDEEKVGLFGTDPRSLTQQNYEREAFGGDGPGSVNWANPGQDNDLIAGVDDGADAILGRLGDNTAGFIRGVLQVAPNLINSPNALAAIAGTIRAEAPQDDLNRLVNDPSVSGLPGWSRGALQFRGDRREALEAALGTNPSAQQQGQWWASKDPDGIRTIANMTAGISGGDFGLQDALGLMHRNQRFANWNKAAGQAERNKRAGFANAALSLLSGLGGGQASDALRTPLMSNSAVQEVANQQMAGSRGRTDLSLSYPSSGNLTPPVQAAGFAGDNPPIGGGLASRLPPADTGGSDPSSYAHMASLPSYAKASPKSYAHMDSMPSYAQPSYREVTSYREIPNPDYRAPDADSMTAAQRYAFSSMAGAGYKPAPEVPKTIKVPYTKRVPVKARPTQQPIRQSRRLPGSVPTRGVGAKLGQLVGSRLGFGPVGGLIGKVIGGFAENIVGNMNNVNSAGDMLTNGQFDPSKGRQLNNAYAVYGTAQARGGGGPVWAVANDGVTRVSGNPNDGSTTIHNKYGAATKTLGGLRAGDQAAVGGSIFGGDSGAGGGK